jgi:hypothetical protein
MIDILPLPRLLEMRFKLAEWSCFGTRGIWNRAWTMIVS